MRAARLAVALALLGLAGCGSARRADVIYLPSTAQVVDRMLALARVGRDDVVYDLGCGDGRIVIAAARERGARGVCNDIDPARIAESRRNAEAAGVAHRIRLDQGDLFELDLAEATVVALYLSPALNRRLRPKLLRELRPGARVVSHNFDMTGWRPDSSVTVAWTSGGTSAVHLWIVPADVAGTWSVAVTAPGGPRIYRVRLEQEYQRITGTASRAGRTVALRGARLRGDAIALMLADTLNGGAAALRLEGRVSGGAMGGTWARDAGRPAGQWRARRP